MRTFIHGVLTGALVMAAWWYFIIVPQYVPEFITPVATNNWFDPHPDWGTQRYIIDEFVARKIKDGHGQQCTVSTTTIRACEDNN